MSPTASSRASLPLAALLASLLAAASTLAQTSVTATYSGNGGYATPGNWDIGTVPVNDATTSYDVVIAPDWLDFPAVAFDLAPGAYSVGSLALGAASEDGLTEVQFSIGAGRSLSVLGNFSLIGRLQVTGPGAAFNATGPGMIDLNLGSVVVEAGASATINVNSINRFSTGYFQADGTGSLLNLASVQSIDHSGPGSEFYATNGGTIDLSGLTTLTGGTGERPVAFLAQNQGVLRLSSLTSIGGSHGFRAFDGGTITTVNPDDPSPRDLVLEGEDSSVFAAFGAGSLLDLRGFRSITRNGESVTVSANDHGVIDFSRLETITHTGSIYFGLYQANDQGVLRLSALSNVFGPNIFEANRGGLIDATSADPAATRALALTGHNFSQFNADGAGSRIDFSSFDTLDCFTEGAGFRITNGAVLDLSRLATLNAYTPFGPGFTAETGGQIDLSSLTTIHGPLSLHANSSGIITTLAAAEPAAPREVTITGTDFINFEADGAGALLDLRGFKSIAREGGGLQIGTANSGVVDLSNLESSTASSDQSIEFVSRTRGHIDLAKLAAVSGPHFIRAENGGTIGTLDHDDPSATRALVVDNGPSGGTAFFSATGTGSLLDLRGLRSIETLNGAGLWIGAEDSSRVDLSNLESITASPEWTSSINANTLGRIELSALARIDGSHSFNAERGALISLAAPEGTSPRTLTVTGANPVFFRAVDADSRLDFTSIGALDLQGGGIVTYAENSGTATFSDLTTSAVTSGNSIEYNALTGGTIALPKLNRLTGPHSFRAGSGGVIDTTSSSGAPARDLVITGTDTTLFFTANGDGSLLDLRGFHSIAAAEHVGLWFGAEDTGRIDLSNLESFTASTDRGASLHATDDGRIDLSTLTTINGSVYINAASGGLVTTAAPEGTPLRTLTIAGPTSTTFRAEDSGSRIDFASIDTLDLQADEISLFAERDGTLAFSDLTSSVNSTGRIINYYTFDGGTIELPQLAAIDGAHGFTASRGGVITAGALSPDTPRVLTLTGPDGTSFRAQDNGSRIDLSAIGVLIAANSGTSFFAERGGTVSLGGLVASAVLNEQSSRFYSNSGTITLDSLSSLTGAHSFSATNGGSLSFGPASGGTRSLTIRNSGPATGSFEADGAGSVIDLSALETITHTGMGSWTRAQNGGLVDLSRLTASLAPAAGVAVEYAAASGGTLRLGNLTTTGVHRIAASDTGTTLQAAGLNLGSATSLALGAGSTLRLGGNYRFVSTSESAYATSASTVAFTGSGTFEVGGFNIGGGSGITASYNNGNFGFGRFVIGAVGAPVTIGLTDLVDNGNRGSFSEALYLFGADGQSGLSLFGGSTLSIGTIPVYVWRTDTSSWLRLNSLFTPGSDVVAYTDGFITVPEPATYALLLGAATLALVAWRVRRTRNTPRSWTTQSFGLDHPNR